MFHTGSSLKGLTAENNNKDRKIDFIKWAKCFEKDHIVREATCENNGYYM